MTTTGFVSPAPAIRWTDDGAPRSTGIEIESPEGCYTGGFPAVAGFDSLEDAIDDALARSQKRLAELRARKAR